MHRASPIAAFSPVLDRNSASPIVRQLYISLRNAIVSGLLPPSVRLPSSRLAAREWRVSRGVITEAYGMLIADSFAFGRHGSGTFVSNTSARIATTKEDSHCVCVPIERKLSPGARALLNVPVSYPSSEQLPFVTGRGAHDERTTRILKRLANRHICFGREYGNSQGDPALRSAIAMHLAVSRGVRCSAERIFVTSGRRQALDIVTRALVTPGEIAVIEDPCHLPIRHILALNGIHALSMPVDEDGIVTNNLRNINGKPAAIYVTPSHQYPSGGTLPPIRRLALLSFAQEVGCWIIENDYDSEFNYESRPITALQGQDNADCVVYIGTFNEALLPNLRVGYFVVPAGLLDAFSVLRPVTDRFPPLFQQQIIADFLNEGYFPQHLVRLRENYRKSRDILAEFIQERCCQFLEVTRPAQGIYLVASSTGQWRDATAFSHFAKKQGVITVPISPMQRQGEANKLILGFSGLSLAGADRGTRVLAKAFTQYQLQCRR